MIPFNEPSSVTARINSAIMITYGNIARKYEALPELLTPLTIIKKTIIQAANRHIDNEKLGYPMPFEMSNVCLSTVFLKET